MRVLQVGPYPPPHGGVSVHVYEARRQLQLAPTAETAELERLKGLLGVDGDLIALNAELCRRLASGAIDPADEAVRLHLWETTLAKLAVDQPNYWGYRAALADRAQV